MADVYLPKYTLNKARCVCAIKQGLVSKKNSPKIMAGIKLTMACIYNNHFSSHQLWTILTAIIWWMIVIPKLIVDLFICGNLREKSTYIIIIAYFLPCMVIIQKNTFVSEIVLDFWAYTNSWLIWWCLQMAKCFD